MIGTSASSSQIALASNTTRALHHATKRSATKASAFTRHRISSRSVRKNGAIKEPSDVTEKISSESSSSSAVGEATASEGADEVKRAPRPATLNRPVSEAAVSSNAALENLKAAGGANVYQSERKSSIITLGLSIHSCPVEIREKMAVPADRFNEAVTSLVENPHIEEAAILSTCNRMEVTIVGLSYDRAVAELENWMSKWSGVELSELREHFFLLKDRDACTHLLAVSGGLDSVVLGEGQILAQVKSVFQMGEGVKGFGRHLNGLFKAAIVAGKRVRNETSIASGAVSVSSAAAELLQMKLPGESYEGTKVMIVGAGTMSKLLVKHLESKRCTEMTILNRTKPRAEALAEEFPNVNMKIHLMEDFIPLAAEHDIIFTASSSMEPIITKEHLDSMPTATDKVNGKRRLVDIAVPRNVCASCSEHAETICYNVDDLKELAEANKAKRNQAAEDARQLLEEELNAFEAWRDSLETVPTIKRLRSKAERIRSQELEKALGKIKGELSNKDKKVFEELSRGIVNKLLHGPMQALRSDGSDRAAVAQTLVNMHALELMFDLRKEDEIEEKEKKNKKEAERKK
jgi:glutamyl-tRNA reductase|mmetsp:Transcript_2404/g.7378  ORF Transcript_2404/g.7378 Transcript_2404/m.7378 type:complete len:577 (-) Transcript_2404:1837-3567(-)